MAAPKSFLGLPMPSFFNEEGGRLWVDLELEEEDVVMVSFVKAGTTWVNKIIHCLLRMDENGILPQIDGADLGASGQIYPEWLPAAKPEDPEWIGVGPGGIFGKVDFSDLKSQPRPRLFSTHCTGEVLPRSLSQRGRLVYVIRNPKDCLNSLHYFRGEAKDGWFGNEHGPGSWERFQSGVNAYGSFCDHVLSTAAVMEQRCAGRSLVVYYEDLKLDLSAGIQRIAEFLGVPISDGKLQEILKVTSFESMAGGSTGQGVSKMLMRKGVAGDWINAPVSDEQWAQFDTWFDTKLGECSIAKPLRPWMDKASFQGEVKNDDVKA